MGLLTLTFLQEHEFSADSIELILAYFELCMVIEKKNEKLACHFDMYKKKAISETTYKDLVGAEHKDIAIVRVKLNKVIKSLKELREWKLIDRLVG